LGVVGGGGGVGGVGGGGARGGGGGGGDTIGKGDCMDWVGLLLVI